jgi:hypothetical protein
MENGFDTKKQVKKTNKETLLRLMKENGIHQIDIKFDGSGDEGQFEFITLFDENECEIEDDTVLDIQCEVIHSSMRFSDNEWVCETYTKEERLNELAEMVCYDPLEENYGGWELNDGSYGTVSLYADGTGSIECNERVIDINLSCKKF